MLFVFPLCFSFLISLACCHRVFQVEGHVSHGVNVFNNLPIVDFSQSSIIFRFFPPIHEVGAFTPGAVNASRIFPQTPLGSLVANIDSFDLQRSIGSPRGVGPWNVPLQKVPTIGLDSANINDRRVSKSFAMTKNPSNIGGPYLSADADEFITLRKWNKASGRISGVCYSDGTAKVKVQLKNGLPNAVYTLWDVGITNPLTLKEQPSAGPFGGLPNVVTTGKAGKGSLVRKLNYCPADKCEGSERCTLYISFFYHFDHMVYAASPALDSGGQPIGQIAGNQIQFFMNAVPLIPVQNKFQH